MVDYWNMPGHENVTKKFESIILYGFISHLIFIMFQIYKMSKSNKKGVSGWLICLEIIVAIIWLT